jgi:phospholysine phosphohistidine inorganic pyrophosphate phosphatase
VSTRETLATAAERPRGLLLDLDGTVYEDDRLIPGAAAAIAELREGGVALRFVTNTTRVPCATIAGWLENYGIPATADDVFTPPRAAVSWLAERGVRRLGLCLPAGSFGEFAAFDIVDRDPEAVVIGDLGPGWTFDVMNQVFRWMLDGVEIVALQRNRYWKTGGELVLDVGAFVAAFEYATGHAATLVGKPSRPMFEAAARSMGLAFPELAMVGDDLLADISGSQAIGIRGFMVRTGKYRAAEVEASEVVPDRVIDSVASLPGLLLG